MGLRLQIEVGPQGAEPGDLFRRATAPRSKIRLRQADADVHVVVRCGGGSELGRLGHVLKPMRPLVLQCPQQDVQLLRLALPQQIEEGARRHFSLRTNFSLRESRYTA